MFPEGLGDKLHQARQWLTHRQALREDQRREDEWGARQVLTSGIPQKPAIT